MRQKLGLKKKLQTLLKFFLARAGLIMYMDFGSLEDQLGQFLGGEAFYGVLDTRIRI